MLLFLNSVPLYLFQWFYVCYSHFSPIPTIHVLCTGLPVEGTFRAYDACDIHSLAATAAINRTVTLVAGAASVANVAAAANASDAAFTSDTVHEKSLVADKNSTTGSVELKLDNGKPIHLPNSPNKIFSFHSLDDCYTNLQNGSRTDFQPATVQPVQIKGANIPSRTSPLVSVTKMLDTTSTIPTKTIAKSGREQLDVDKALCPCGATTKLEYLFNGVNKRNASNADVDFIMEAKVVEKVSNVVCLIFYLLYFIFCILYSKN